MHQIPPLRPFAAEIGLGGSAVLADAPVEAAGHTVLAEIPAGRNHLGLDGIVLVPLGLAEVGGLAGPHQRLEPGLATGAHDLDLEVPAAGGAPRVVGGPTGGAEAGVGAEDGQARLHVHRGPVHQPALVHQEEPVPAELPGLGRAPGAGRGGTPEAVRVAAGPAAVLLEVLAGDVEPRVHQEFPLPGVEAPEIQLGGVAKQPGRLVVERLDALLDLADPEGHVERPAL